MLGVWVEPGIQVLRSDGDHAAIVTSRLDLRRRVTRDDGERVEARLLGGLDVPPEIAG